MKIVIVISFWVFLSNCSTEKETSITKAILLEELRNNHTTKDWYVPLGTAVEGLTKAQANWKDSANTHSIKELTAHLAFWNDRILISFQGGLVPQFDDNNETTFKKFDSIDWDIAVRKLDSIQGVWEESVEKATQQQLENWGSEIANMASHNAYHTGQIVYIRKKNGWWDESKGVK